MLPDTGPWYAQTKILLNLMLKAALESDVEVIEWSLSNSCRKANPIQPEFDL